MERTTTKSKMIISKGVTTMGVRDTDGTWLQFNSEKVGPKDYFGLRKAKYGPEGFNFIQPTFGELASLASASLENKSLEEAKRFIEACGTFWITGKTLAVTGRDGLLVDDDPDSKLLQNVTDYQKYLKNKLGSREENGIVYSPDGLVRFVHGEFKYEAQTLSDFAKNKGLIALVKTPERAEMLAKAARHYKLNPWLGGGFASTDLPKLIVPQIILERFFDGRVGVNGFNPTGDNWCSFGVRRIAEGTQDISADYAPNLARTGSSVFDMD